MCRLLAAIVDWENYLDKLEKFSYRVLKEDCLDLPEKVFTRRLVELTDEQKKVYRQMKEMALAVLDDGKMMSTMNVMTQLMRLHQVTCGHFKADDGTISHLKNNRIDCFDGACWKKQRARS